MVGVLIASDGSGYTVTAAIIALCGTLLVLLFNIFDRSRSAFDDRMVKATELLTGGSQKRSAGIAIIEGARGRLTGSGFGGDAWRQAAIGLLFNQAVYLLECSSEGDRPDEIRNLQRIVGLLTALVKGREQPYLKDFKAVAESLTRSSSSTDDRRKEWKNSSAKERAPVGLFLSTAEVGEIQSKLRELIGTGSIIGRPRSTTFQ